MILVFYCIFFEVSPVDIIFGIRVFFIAFVGKKKKERKKYFYFVCTQLHFGCLGNASKGAKGREGRVSPPGGRAHT